MKYNKLVAVELGNSSSCQLIRHDIKSFPNLNTTMCPKGSGNEHIDQMTCGQFYENILGGNFGNL